MRFRKKPLTVDAVQLGDGLNHPAVTRTAPARGSVTPRGVLWTKSGQVFVEPGDWLIGEIDGSGFYPCKPDIFAAIYEPISPDDDAIGSARHAADELYTEMYPTRSGTRCPKCGRQMAHYRLRGYRCSLCD